MAAEAGAEEPGEDTAEATATKIDLPGDATMTRARTRSL
jgi:hypothetical protein